MPAPHFSPKALAFFRQLEKNNDRQWFTPRKAIFEQEVRDPMLELVGWLNDKLRAFAVDHIVDPPRKAIYRIYRDTRFSNDKTPYKTHIGAIFPRQGLPKHGGASYYVGISHTGIDVAGGIYGPGPEELAAVRNAIVADPKKVEKLFGAKAVTKWTGSLQGDQLVRLPKGFDAEPGTLNHDLFRRKQLYFGARLDADEATTSKLGPETIKRFEAMAAAMDWMNDVLLAAKREEESKAADDDRPKRPKPMF